MQTILNNKNKGAMFGLDARIALAIFGALSVISGAALYSAIQSANITQRIAQVKEVKKAIEQYILDTGSMIPFSTTTSASDLSAYALVEKPSGVTGWKGPYLNLEKNPSTDYLKQKDLNVAITFSRTDSFTPATNCLRSSPDCAVYIVYTTEDTYNSNLEETLDSGTADYSLGNFRVRWGHQYFKTSIPFNKANSPSA